MCRWSRQKQVGSEHGSSTEKATWLPTSSALPEIQSCHRTRSGGCRGRIGGSLVSQLAGYLGPQGMGLGELHNIIRKGGGTMFVVSRRTVRCWPAWDRAPPAGGLRSVMPSSIPTAAN